MSRIFVTVGTQLPFDRLVQAMDSWAGTQSGVQITAQVGSGSYKPQHLQAMATLDVQAFRALCESSDLIVSHAGVGSILLALELGKPVLVMPRRASFGEHRNDHQLATIRYLQDKPGIFVAADETVLPAAIALALNGAGGSLSPYASPELLQAVTDFIDG